MFFVTAAVGFVTAGFLENLFQIEFLGIWTIVILFGVCTAILSVGKYQCLRWINQNYCKCSNNIYSSGIFPCII